MRVQRPCANLCADWYPVTAQSSACVDGLVALGDSPGFLPNQKQHSPASPVTMGSNGLSTSSRLQLASSGSLFPGLSAAAHSWLLISLLPPGLFCGLVGHLPLLLLPHPYTVCKFPTRAKAPFFRRGIPSPEKASDCCDAHAAFRVILASRLSPPN